MKFNPFADWKTAQVALIIVIYFPVSDELILTLLQATFWNELEEKLLNKKQGDIIVYLSMLLRELESSS